MQIKFTPTARSQFLERLGYIKKENPKAAQSFRVKSEQVLKRLVDYPESGKSIREYPDLPFLEVVVPPYRFFYRVRDEIIWVVAVWHSSQMGELPL